MQSRVFTTRIALLSGGVLAASMFLPVLGLNTAHADQKTERKASQYKTGAVVLGAAAAYFGLKSKQTVPAIIAGAGAYYAYKKGRDLDQQSNNNRYGYGYGQDGNINNGHDVYPDDNGYNNGGNYDNGGYANYPNENGSYNNGGYDNGYNNGGRYDNRGRNDRGNYNNRGGSYAGLPGDEYPDYAGLKAQTPNHTSRQRLGVK